MRQIELAVDGKIKKLQEKVDELCTYQNKMEYVHYARNMSEKDELFIGLVNDYESMIKIDEDALSAEIKALRTAITEEIGEILECI